MNDSDRTQAAQRQPVNVEKFLEFLRQRKANPACPSCGQNNWGVITDIDNAFPSILLYDPGGFQIPPPVLPVVLVGCDNCGFARLHLKSQYNEWLQSGGASDGE